MCVRRYCRSGVWGPPTPVHVRQLSGHAIAEALEVAQAARADPA